MRGGASRRGSVVATVFLGGIDSARCTAAETDRDNVMDKLIDRLANLDRRWIFLMMLVAVAVPILFKLEFPETPTQQAKAVFDEIEHLQPGDPVLLAFD